MRFYTILLFLIISVSSYAQSVTTVTVAINQPETCLIAGIEKPALEDISIYPNPAKQDFTVLSNSIMSEVSLINASGKTVYSKKINSKEITVKVSGLKKGLYQCLIINSQGLKQQAIIIQ